MRPPIARWPGALAGGLLLALVASMTVHLDGRQHPRVGPGAAGALPLYAARAGRTCDNCHADPTGWNNPKLSQRKCNLSCLTCHLNPGGGGPRNVVGRYYGKATLPMWLSSHRPYKDRNRDIPFLKLSDKRKNWLWDPAVGRTPGGPALMAYDETRYNGLRADPLFMFGIDTRYALWLAGGSALFFPMQIDAHAALHPVRHVTAEVTGGVLAKSKGYGATFERDTPFMVKDVFVMLHQLPYMSYLRVGRFIPTFGTYLEDHTVPTRRDFELDQGQLASRVTGVEVGLAPNYPFAHLSVFRPNEADLFRGNDPVNTANPPFLGVSGWGAAASLGWRDLGWAVGASGMLRRRELADGGDTEDVAVHWTFNPWYYLEWLPLTYLGEVVFGARRRPLSGTRAGHYAAFHELSALVSNGINLRVHYDFSDPDMDVIDDHFHRVTFGAEIILIPAAALRADVRTLVNSGAGRAADTDFFLQLHGWY